MKRNNGFTLVELLAVIVVLGVIMVIAGSSLTAVKKKANIDEAKEIEEMLTNLGADVYLNVEGASDISLNESKKIFIYDLYTNGYLKSSKLENPAGGDECEGYLEITKTEEGPVFQGYVCCPALYETNSDKTPSSCSIK